MLLAAGGPAKDGRPPRSPSPGGGAAPWRDGVQAAPAARHRRDDHRHPGRAAIAAAGSAAAGDGRGRSGGAGAGRGTHRAERADHGAGRAGGYAFQSAPGRWDHLVADRDWEENATAGDIQRLAADDGSDPRSGRLIAEDEEES